VAKTADMNVKRKWEYEDIQNLIRLRTEGYTHAAIGQQLHRTVHAIRYKITELVASGVLKTSQPGHNFAKIRDIDLPIYTETPVIYGNCIVVGDIHIPTTFWELAELVDTVADLHLENPRTLIIAGDFINADALSRYPPTVPMPSLEEELAIARDMLSTWSQTFDSIIIIMGNHEMRIFKQLYGSIGETEVKSLFATGLRDIVQVYNIGQVIVKHEDITWRITHPAAYSKIKGRVADKLAQKHQMNIISHHEHHLLQSRDEFDNYTIINNGGLHDHEKMAYVSQVDNTRPVMNNGFVMLRDGYPYMFTPYRTWTNWDDWGIDASDMLDRMDQRRSRRIGV
jgi:hypothetical protein